MPEKSKQEVREQTQMVKKILEQQGKVYEDWLYEMQGHFIDNSVGFLLDLIDKNKQETK